MTSANLSKRIIADRLHWIDAMLAAIKALPLDDREVFFADTRNTWAAESCLRRALEALLDLGRHILAKGFGVGVSEYGEIAVLLGDKGVLPGGQAKILRQMAGYRNRMVHFYHQASGEELFTICSQHLDDIPAILATIRNWLLDHPDMLDQHL